MGSALLQDHVLCRDAHRSDAHTVSAQHLRIQQQAIRMSEDVCRTRTATHHDEGRAPGAQASPPRWKFRKGRADDVH